MDGWRNGTESAGHGTISGVKIQTSEDHLKP